MAKKAAKNEPLEDAVAHFGTRAAMARALGIRQQACAKWRGQIPPQRVMDLERLTGIPRSTLRPDLYPPERERV